MTRTPTLLLDEPSNVDDLGGAHARIATTISKLVLTSPGGQTIRLDGTWGAGKSTVVKIVAEQLEHSAPKKPGKEVLQSPDVAVFQYDAWVHVGDPLRRAFLSALVQKLTERKWLENSDGTASESLWTKRLDQLSRRLKTTSRKTTPFFSNSAKVILSALAALGIAAPMLAELEKRLIEPLGVAPLLASTALTGFVAFALFHLLSNEAMGFIIRRNSDEEAVEVRDDPEPTSIEFQDAFGELMQVILEQDNRRLVIVIDNLDRIDQADTKAVWALLRSFLDNPQFKSHEWLRRLWVLIPVADEGRVLQSSTPASAVSAKDPAPSSFLEKVFQLRFSLPPPMLHSWKNYFNGKLVQAFGEDLLGDYDEILRLYEELPLSASLTPRAIVSFVNELVLLKIEWSDKVSLSSLAAYLLSKEKLLADSCVPPTEVTRILREESLADTFAMLHHHASTKEEASYISVRPRLEAALDNGDSEALSRLFQESPAFQFVLDRYIRQDLSALQGQQERLLQAVRAICPLAIAEDGTQLKHKPLTAGTMLHFRQVALSTMAASKSLRLLNENLVSGLQALLDISSSREQTAMLIVEMLRNIVATADDQPDPLTKQIAVAWEAWTSSLGGVLSISEVHSAITAEGAEQIALPVGAELWARLCQETRHTERSWILTCCTCRGGEDAKLTWLRTRFESEKMETAAVALLKQAMETGEEHFFDAIAEGIVKKQVHAYKISSWGSDDYLIPSLAALFSLDRLRLKPYLRRLVDSGELFRVFGTSTPTSDWKSAVLIYFIVFATDGMLKTEITAFLGGKESVDGLQFVTRLVEGKIGLNTDQVRNFVEVLDTLAVYEVLQLLATGWGNKGLITSLVPALALSERFIYYIRAQGDFKTELIAFANKYVIDPQLRHQFVESALSTEESTAAQKSFGDESILIERLREVQIPA
ncbi:KAP family NTPase [Paraburkholderia sp. D15]|uniref:P-loop NTPase fold protein n=1 Tax=Paraburkholderia sp. D15 TaxID=2880218 RepID=UPI0024783C1C|nr:P-loop NTPase fold protein [Paraburkholderia sp. D15]WGS54336.1 KAP family NTPase [Paraburkholderia sp. D15]